MKKIVIAKTYMLTEKAEDRVCEYADKCNVSTDDAIRELYEESLFTGEGLVESKEPNDPDMIIAIYEEGC